jgi:hypothetical protein
MPEVAQLAADFWTRGFGLDVGVRVGDEAALKKGEDLGDAIYGQILWRDNETRVDAASAVRGRYSTPENPGRLHNDPELFALVHKTLAISGPAKRLEAINKLCPWLREESFWIQTGHINIP